MPRPGLLVFEHFVIYLFRFSTHLASWGLQPWIWTDIGSCRPPLTGLRTATFMAFRACRSGPAAFRRPPGSSAVRVERVLACQPCGLQGVLRPHAHTPPLPPSPHLRRQAQLGQHRLHSKNVHGSCSGTRIEQRGVLPRCRPQAPQQARFAGIPHSVSGRHLRWMLQPW